MGDCRVIAVCGPVDSAISPRLVLPLSKSRLCHDERYLNLCIRDLQIPFTLDHLYDLPQHVLPGHFRPLVMIRLIISLFCFILLLKLTWLLVRGLLFRLSYTPVWMKS